MKPWGANTWEIERDIGLARAFKQPTKVAELEEKLKAAQASCEHRYPEPLLPADTSYLPHDPRRYPTVICWKCGAER